MALTTSRQHQLALAHLHVKPYAERHIKVYADSTVARVWAEHDVKPWQSETFKFSTDPQLAAKVRDVVGLYLDPRAP